MESMKGMITMSITLRLSSDEIRLIKNYAALKGVSVSEIVRRAIFEKMEDEIDLELARKALEDFQANPITYTHDEVGRMLGLK